MGDLVHLQVIKHQRKYRLVEVEQRVLRGESVEYRSCLQLKGAVTSQAPGLSVKINTSFVERANLTIRQSVSQLTRRTWGTAPFTAKLSEHLEWRRAFYHFVRYHERLRISMAEPVQQMGKLRPRQYRKLTPAMVAGLANQRWTVMELISYPLP